MTLANGLAKMEGLKELRQISFDSMGHYVKLVDLQWMIAHWLKLTAVYGLDYESEEYK